MARCLAVLMLIGQPAFAAVTLVYEAEPQLACPDEETLRRLIAARLGHDPFVDGGEAQVTVRIKAGAPVTAEVVLESPRGATPRRKSLAGPNCAALLNSVALTVALAVDPLVRKAEARPENTPPVAEPLPAEEADAAPADENTPPVEPQRVVEARPAAPIAAPQQSAATKSAPGLHGSVSAGASVNLGVSVVAQPTLRVEGRLHGSFWSVGAEARFGWPVTTALAEGTLTTSAILGAVVPCLTWKWLSGCADVTAGALRLDGQGLVDARLATVFHFAVGLRALFIVPIWKVFTLGAMAEFQVPLTRATALVGTTRVWTVWPVGGGLGLWAGLAL